MYQVTCPEDVKALAGEIRRESRTDDQESDLLDALSQEAEKTIRKCLDAAIDHEDNDDRLEAALSAGEASAIAVALEGFTNHSVTEETWKEIQSYTPKVTRKRS